MQDIAQVVPEGVWQFGLAGIFLLLLFIALKKGELQVKDSVDQRLADKDAQIAILKDERDTLKEALKTKDGQIDRLSVVHDFQTKAWMAVERVVERADREGGK